MAVDVKPGEDSTCYRPVDWPLSHVLIDSRIFSAAPATFHDSVCRGFRMAVTRTLLALLRGSGAMHHLRLTPEHRPCVRQVYSRKHALSLGADDWPQNVPNDYGRDVEGGDED